MPHNEAKQVFNSGLQLLHAEKYDQAIVAFTQAISLDPDFADAYHYRGELLTMNGRLVEGNADLQKAKALRSGGAGKYRKKRDKIGKYNLQEVENICENVFPEGAPEQETVEFENRIYDYVFADDTLETEKLWDGLIGTPGDSAWSPSILEFVGGRREEVFRAHLFQPTNGDITILQEESGEQQRVVPLRELNCIRLAKAPAGCGKKTNDSCQIEIIETRDGSIYHEYIDPQQDLESCLMCFSTKENTHFPYSFFPRVNVKLRYQDRFLGEILLEKRYIAQDILRSVLEEHQTMRSMQLGRIIARQANILYAEVDSAITRAQAAGMHGLRTGEILLDSGLVNEEQVMDALEFQEKMQNKKLGEFLVEKGILREKELYITLAEKFRMPFIDLRQQKVSKKTLTLLPREIVLQFKVLPLALKEATLVVAAPSPDVSAARDAILQNCRLDSVEFVLAQPTHLKNVVNILYRDRRRQGEEA